MARSEATLSTELQALPKTLGSGSAALALAYKNYMNGATALTPIEQAATPVAATAMAAAMTFAAGATPAAGATIIANGLIAFWAAMNIPASSFFLNATVVTPPAGLSTIIAGLTSVLTDNADTELTSAEACDALAAVIHAASNGGTATTPTAVVTPIL